MLLCKVTAHTEIKKQLQKTKQGYHTNNIQYRLFFPQVEKE